MELRQVWISQTFWSRPRTHYRAALSLRGFHVKIRLAVMAPISHSFEDETPEAKARWFRSLTVDERIAMLCAWTDLILENNPGIAERKDAQPVTGRIRVLTLPRR